MSEQVPLREYVDAIFRETNLRNEQRFQATESRLTGMNEFRGTVSDIIGKCITREESRSQIVAACSVTGAVMAVIMVAIALIGFFLRK